jgi:MFS family permease
VNKISLRNISLKNISDLTALNITSFLKSQSYILPVILLFYNQNGLSVADYLYFQSILCFAELIFGLPSGRLADRWQKKYVMLLSCFMLFTRYALWLFCKGYYIVLAGEICYALYKCLFQCSAEGYIYQYLCDHKKERINLKKYGYFNYYASIGTAISALLGAVIFKYTGIRVILCIQMLIVAASIFLLAKIEPVKVQPTTNRQSIRNIIALCKQLKNTDLKFYILITSFFSALTILFVNSFQPLMQFGNVPIVLLGTVYFFNNITRAGTSLKADKIIKFIGLRKMAKLVNLLFAIMFIAMYVVLKNNLSTYILPLLLAVCLTIAMQLCLHIGIVSYLQENSTISTRSTISSVCNTSIRLITTIVLFIGTSNVKDNGLITEVPTGLAVVVILSGILCYLKDNAPVHNTAQE